MQWLWRLRWWAEFKQPRKQFPAQSSTQDLLAKRHKFHLTVGKSQGSKIPSPPPNQQWPAYSVTASHFCCRRTLWSPHPWTKTPGTTMITLVTTETSSAGEVRIEGRVKREKWVLCPPNTAPRSPDQQGLRARGVLNDPWHKEHFSIPSLIPEIHISLLKFPHFVKSFLF